MLYFRAGLCWFFQQGSVVLISHLLATTLEIERGAFTNLVLTTDLISGR